MRLKLIETTDIQNLIQKGLAKPGTEEISLAFNAFITKNYPWVDYTFDSIKWSLIKNSITLELSRANDVDVRNFIISTTLGKYELVCIVYGARQPCLITDLEFLIENIDLLCRGVGNTCYFFGVLEENGHQHYVFQDFVEWDADDGFKLSGVRETAITPHTMDKF